MIEIFSPLEEKVILAVKKNKTHTITELVPKIYKRSDQPLSPASVISCTIGRINNKCDRYNLNWKIDGKNNGRNGRVVKITKRSTK